MDGQTTNEGLDFSESLSTNDQTDLSNVSPENTNEQEENQENQETNTTAQDGGQVEGNSDDAQVDDAVLEHFLESKGINANEPEISKATLLKLGKMAYNSERQYKSGTQEIAQLKRQISEQGNASQQIADGMQDQQVIQPPAEQQKNDFVETVNAWTAAKKITPEDESKMVEWIKQPTGKDPRTGQPLAVRANLLMGGIITLDDVYRAAGCGNNTATDELKGKMMEEVKKEMAARQNAKRPAASATNSTQFGNKTDRDDAFLQGLLGK